MAVTAKGEEYLRCCADRAVAELEYGGPMNAITSVMTDFAINDLTLGLDRLVIVSVIGPAAEKGPEELRKAIMNFSV